MAKKTYADIRPRDIVTIWVPAGHSLRDGQLWAQKSGHVVMRGPAGWVINMGGQYGTPGICNERNFVGFDRARHTEQMPGYIIGM